MKLGKHLIVALVLVVFSTISQAKEYTFTVEADLYAGIGYSFIGYQIKDIEADSADLAALYFQGGIKLYDWVSFELRAGSGIDEGEAYLLFIDDKLTVKVGNFYGTYLKVGYPHLGSFYPYIIAGQSDFDTEVDIPGYESVEESYSGISYGGGVDMQLSALNNVPTWFNFIGFDFEAFNLPEYIVLNTEYMQFLNQSSASLGGLNLGIKYVY